MRSLSQAKAFFIVSSDTWPGNVRDLQEVIKHAWIIAEVETMTQQLPLLITSWGSQPPIHKCRPSGNRASPFFIDYEFRARRACVVGCSRRRTRNRLRPPTGRFSRFNREENTFHLGRPAHETPELWHAVIEPLMTMSRLMTASELALDSITISFAAS